RQRRSANRCGPAAREGGTTACSACSVPPCNDTDSNTLYGLWLSRSLVAGESEVDTCVSCRLGPARGDRLLLGEEVEPLDAICLRAAEQCVLPATERVVPDRHGDRHVDADHAHLRLILEAAGRPAVVGEDGSAVTEPARVDQVHPFLECLHAHHREYRSEDLLLIRT